MSMIFFMLQLALLAGLAAYLADSPGTVHITWHDYVIDTSASFLGVTILGLGLVLYFIFRMGHFIKYGPGLWRIRRRLKNTHEGQRYIDQSILALAGGNAPEAGKIAINARKKLGVSILTQTLQAQAAQLAGDYSMARNIFRDLAARKETAVLGYRGLIMDAKREENWQEVERLVNELHQLKPQTPWLNTIRFDLHVRNRDWQQANLALSNIGSARLLPSQDLADTRAAIFVALSKQKAEERQFEDALKWAEKAIQQKQNWLPAIINLAQQQMTTGNKRTAYRTIAKYWPNTPHPHLASLYYQGERDSLEAYRQLQRLCKSYTPLNRLILAEAALAANIWGEAKRHLTEIVNHRHATQSIYKMLARIELHENGNAPSSRLWLDKVLETPPDPAWLCGSCGGTHPYWQATCSHCGQFNTLDWRTPGQSYKAEHKQILYSQGWID